MTPNRCEVMPRRGFLKTFPAIGAASAFPAFAQAQSPLRAIYYRWQGIKDEFSALPTDCSSKIEAPIFNEMLRLEQFVADFEPRTIGDLYFKIIFADDNGDMALNIHQTALVTHSYAMLGIEPRVRNGALA